MVDENVEFLRPLDPIYALGGYPSSCKPRKIHKGLCIFCKKKTSHKKNILKSNGDLEEVYSCIDCSLLHKDEFF